jgi:tRNA A-37 threonylcarbamoyl transferase component Bud32
VTARRLPHGYTNESWAEQDLVYKRYVGNDAADRLRVEVEALAIVAHPIPVPKVVQVQHDTDVVVLSEVVGRHGQELIDSGHAARVLLGAGKTLRTLQRAVPGLVHGDYGPQNLLFDAVSFAVVAVLDWEFAHGGDAVEDLAWAEWIVRMHHAGAIGHLGALFEGYQDRPAWASRHDAMQARCDQLRRFCALRGDQQSLQEWDLRTRLTAGWRE